MHLSRSIDAYLFTDPSFFVSDIKIFLKLWSLLTVLCFSNSLFAEKLSDAIASQYVDDHQVLLSEDDELIVALRIEKFISGADLFIYKTPEYTMIPVSMLVEELDFAYKFNIDELSMDGWQGDETNTLSSNFQSKVLYFRGVRQEWPTNLRYAEDGFDLYLDQQTIQNWLGIKIELDISQLEVNVTSKTPIPIAEKLKRIAKREEVKSNRVEIETYPDSYLRNQYAWWDVPNLDLTFGYDAQSDNGQIDSFQNIVLQGRGDLLKHSLRSSFINNDGEADLRFTFSKASQGPEDTLFFGINRYELGDIASLTDPLLFSSVKGRGLFFERGGKSVRDRGDTITIEGDAPPNWEAELFRNGSLIEFSQTTIDGRYEFLSVPTFIGENNFEVRLYGPQGQFRSAREQVTIGGSMLKKGEWEYQAYLINRNKNLIDSELNAGDEESNFILAETSYGLSQYFSLQAGISQMTPTKSDESKDYIYGSLFGSFAGGLGELKYAQDDTNSTALAASLKTRLLNTNFNLEFLNFDKLISDRNRDGDLQNDINFRFNRVLNVGLPSSVLFDLTLGKKTYQSGLESNQVTNRLSTGWASFQLAHDLTFTNDNLADNVDDLEAELSATRKWDDWRLKGAFGYRIEPETDLDDISFNASYNFTSDMIYSGSVLYDLRNDRALSSENNFTVDFDKYSLTFNAGFNTRGAEFFGLTLTSSLGYEKFRNDFYFANESLVSNSNLTARVFIDEDNSQTYDAGEEPLEGVRFAGSSRWNKEETDINGLVTLRGLPHLEMQKIELNDKSLQDPFLQPAKPPVYIYTHAGTHTYVDVPIAQTVEVEGSLQIESEGFIKPASGFSIYLTDLQGQRMAETNAEFDGIFLFEPMLPGDYCVALDESDIEKKKIQAPELGCFSLKGDEGVYFIDDITLSRL